MDTYANTMSLEQFTSNGVVMTTSDNEEFNGEFKMPHALTVLKGKNI